MTDNTDKTLAKKKLKKRLLRLGLSVLKPLLWLGALLLLADCAAFIGLFYTCGNGGFLPVLYLVLSCAFTTALLLVLVLLVYESYRIKTKLALHLLKDVKGLLGKTEQTLRRHLQTRQEKDFRQTVRLALENLSTDQTQQKELLDRLQALNLNLPAMEKDPAPASRQESRLERLTRFLNQSADTFAYLQQIYNQLQEFGISSKETAPSEDETLQAILTEVNRLREQLENLHTTE